MPLLNWPGLKKPRQSALHQILQIEQRAEPLIPSLASAPLGQNCWQGTGLTGCLSLCVHILLGADDPAVHDIDQLIVDRIIWWNVVILCQNKGLTYRLLQSSQMAENQAAGLSMRLSPLRNLSSEAHCFHVTSVFTLLYKQRLFSYGRQKMTGPSTKMQPSSEGNWRKQVWCLQGRVSKIGDILCPLLACQPC